jgi:hypothetical protein
MSWPLVAITAARETVDYARAAITSSIETVIASLVPTTSSDAATHLFAGGADRTCRGDSPRRCRQ